jgi:hypothetical protein
MYTIYLEGDKLIDEDTASRWDPNRDGTYSHRRQMYTIYLEGDKLIDEDTASRWDPNLPLAISGSVAGKSFQPNLHLIYSQIKSFRKLKSLFLTRRFIQLIIK